MALVFGIAKRAASGTGPDIAGWVAWLSRASGLAIDARIADSYEALADETKAGSIDIAWLPPIVLTQLGDRVEILGSIARDGRTSYEAALIVRADSKLRTIESLRGTRAGWVDRWSAAGFVLPRVKLAILGVDPRTSFRTETFFGSHDAAIRALIDGVCDVTGTHARTDDEGKIVAGGWSDVEGADVRVLETFGAIPPDAIAVKASIPPETRLEIVTALEEADEEGRALTRSIFGGDELHAGAAPGYDALKKALEMAQVRGLFD